ncbi:hypothetical protein [Amycolatopsis sp. RTGN1]|uniref:hypothetical protein n=1 Tax=Amycolatopsis ponsaeliensis TaxID=2992142 RepID=UPI00254F71D6|nr:hypothetical protein [Amycolatopsis sp. RTGN1]
MEITSGGTEGPRLGDELALSDTNVYGLVLGDDGPEELARTFARAGWRARKSSYDEYEVEHTWARLRFFRDRGGADVFAGTVDPAHLARLAGTFTGLGLTVRIDGG